MPRGRGNRDGFHPSYGQSFHSGRMHPESLSDVPNNHSYRNDMDRGSFGAHLGGSHLSRYEGHYESQRVAEDGYRMESCPSDPRLAPQYGRNQSGSFYGANSNHPVEAPSMRGRPVQPFRPEMNQLCQPHLNKEFVSGRQGRQLPQENLSEKSQGGPHVNHRPAHRKLPIEMLDEPTIIDKGNQANPNLDSFVHNLLDSFQLDASNDVSENRSSNPQCEEKEEGEEDDDEEIEDDVPNFPAKYAEYQRSFDDPEFYAVASDRQIAKSSTPATNRIQPNGKIKTEPRENDQTNDLRRSSEDIRHRKMAASSIPHSSRQETVSRKESSKCNERRSSQKSKGPSAERLRSSDTPHRHRNVEDLRPSSSAKNRLKRNDSPMFDRGRVLSARDSPEWHRQVRIVGNSDESNRVSRDREFRRCRRTRSRSRSRSHSRSPRRSQRHNRLISPSRHHRRSRSISRNRLRSRSRSRSRRSYRLSRSPDRGSRQWTSGSGRSSRNSRSPVRSRRRSPLEHIQRNVVERAVVLRGRSRSRSLSVSRDSPLHPTKRLKEIQEQLQEPTPVANPLPVPNEHSTQHSTQFFTRGYVSANLNPPPPDTYAQMASTRYVVPPTQHPPQPLAPVYPFMNNYFNQQQPLQPFGPQQVPVYQHQQLHIHQVQPPTNNPFPIHQNGNLHVIPLTSSNHLNTASSTSVSSSAAVSNPAPSTSANAETAQAEQEHRIRTARDGLLEKQTKLVHQLLVLRMQQNDLEMKQKASKDGEFDRFSANIMEKAKLEKELTVSAQSLQKLIEKHTTQLKEDLSDVKKARSGYRYSYFDPCQHWCELCDVIADKLSDYLSHLHSKEHEERLQSTGVPSTPWHKKRQVPEETDTRIINRVPMNGIQSLLPVKAWYCELCDSWMGDIHCAQLHMSSSEHNERHLKLSMERTEVTFALAAKRQSALRRHEARKREEENLKNEQKNAEKLKLAAEKREAAKRKEEERKIAQEKWDNMVRQEEMNKVCELEEPVQKIAEAVQSQEETNPPSNSKNIRLNIRTPMISSKTNQSQSEPNVEGMKSPEAAVDSNLTDKEIVCHQQSPETSAEDGGQNTSEVCNPANTSSSALNSAEHDGRAPRAVPDLIPVTRKDRTDATSPLSMDQNGCQKIQYSESLKDLAAMSKNLSVSPSSPISEMNQTPKETDRVEVADAVTTTNVSQEINGNYEMMEASADITEPAARIVEQMVSVIQLDVSTLSVPMNLDCRAEKSDQQPTPPSQQMAEDTTSGVPTGVDPNLSAPSTSYDSPQSPPPCVPVDKSDSSSLSDPLPNKDTDLSNVDNTSRQNGQSTLNLSIDKSVDASQNGREELVLKIEPRDECAEPTDSKDDGCVILAVTPKVNKVIEVIVLDSSSDDDSGQSDTEASSRPMTDNRNKELVSAASGIEKKSDGSETPCRDESSSHQSAPSSAEVSVQLSDFIVLSETNDDGFVESECSNELPVEK